MDYIVDLELLKQSFLPVTFTTMNTNCKMAVKFHVFTIVTTRKPIISNPCPKFL